MFDIGWTELLLIGIVALIVVGPQELPGMFRKLGQLTGKARGLARDFQRAMDNAADEAGVKDIKRDFRKMASDKSLGLDDIETSISSGLKPSSLNKASDFNNFEKKTTTPVSAPAAEAVKTNAAKAADPATKKATTKPAVKPAAKPAAKTTTKTAAKSVPIKAAASDVAPPVKISETRKVASAARVAEANAKLTPAKKTKASAGTATKPGTKGDPA